MTNTERRKGCGPQAQRRDESQKPTCKADQQVEDAPGVAWQALAAGAQELMGPGQSEEPRGALGPRGARGVPGFLEPRAARGDGALGVIRMT
jgi:hypothetical protein